MVKLFVLGAGLLSKKFVPGTGLLSKKNCPGDRLLNRNCSGPGVSLGGMVTSQITISIFPPTASLSSIVEKRMFRKVQRANDNPPHTVRYIAQKTFVIHWGSARHQTETEYFTLNREMIIVKR